MRKCKIVPDVSVLDGEMVKRSSSFNVRVKLGRWASAPTQSLQGRFRQAEAGGGRQHDRRESFLYQNTLDRSNFRPFNDISGNSPPLEDQIVTPFAQILASLKEVRSSLHQLSQGARPGDGGQAEAALQELDWCLDQLETMDTTKGVANMAASKFKNMLNRELSVLSEKSNDGKMLANHIKGAYYDRSYDHEFDEGDERRKEEEMEERKEKKGSGKEVNGLSETLSQIKAQKSLVATSPTESVLSSPFGVNANDPRKLQEVMADLGNIWGLDVFTASNLIRQQRVLTCTTYRILQERDLLTTFQIPSSTLVCFLMTLEDHYLKDVKYHNHLHAADVTQSCHVLLNSPQLREVFTPLETLAALLASSLHDVDHPGTTNQYLVTTGSDLALMYNDESVLENHHLAVAFKLLQLPECDILAGLSSKQRASVRKMVIDMVLATDMSKHMSLLADLKTMVETKKVAGSGVLLLDNYSDRIQVLQNLIHCCDLSNPTKPLALYTQWVDRLMEESFKQGDKERELGLDLSPLCDRNTVNVAKCQVGFISYIVHPLWETMAELVFPAAQHIMATLEDNRLHYKEIEEKSSPAEE